MVIVVVGVGEYVVNEMVVVVGGEVVMVLFVVVVVQVVYVCMCVCFIVLKARTMLKGKRC